jgi:predicted dehydrogenase
MPLKIAVVGTGPVAVGNYLPFLVRQPDVELAYWNRTAASAREAAAKFGGKVCADLRELAAWTPTTALVLVNERVRKEVAMELIELGLPRLFFEKPLVAAAGQGNVSEQDYFDGKALLARARQTGCETAMVFNYRFFEHTVAAKAIVADRRFGRVLTASGFVHFACWSHAIDLIRHFCGDLAEVSALRSPSIRRSEEIKTDAADVVAAFTTRDGATGTILGTAGAAWQHPLYELIFNFERGRLHLRDLDGALEIYDARGSFCERRDLAPHRSRWDQYRDSFEKSLAAYLESLRAGGPPPISGREGLAELQVEAGLRRSIAERRAIRLDEAFPL